MTTNFSSMKASGKMVKNMVRLSILHVYNNEIFHLTFFLGGGWGGI